MPKYDVFHLRFKSGLHLSSGKADNYDSTESVLHSDTLKSAIYVNARLLYGEAADEAFFHSFKVSSAFPYFRTNTQLLHFVARPHLPNFHQYFLEEQVDYKFVKKIEYIEVDLLRELLENKVALSSLSSSKDGKFIAALSEEDRSLSNANVFGTASQQHVAVDRFHEADANPYGVDALYFHERAGLYFLLDCTGTEAQCQMAKAGIKALADAGLGTDRNTGKGQFEFLAGEDVTTHFYLPEKGTQQMSLSLYCPKTATPSEIATAQLQDSYYQLLRRGGYIATPDNLSHIAVRKRSVYMFREGSVFPRIADRTGQVVNLQPDNDKLTTIILNKAEVRENPAAEKRYMPAVDHPIWRDGRAIFLNF